MSRRHAPGHSIDEVLQLQVQGVDSRETQLSSFGIKLGIRLDLGILLPRQGIPDHHVRGLGLSRHSAEARPAVGAQHRAVPDAVQQRVRNVVAVADHPLQLPSAAIDRRDHGHLLPREAGKICLPATTGRTRDRRSSSLPAPAALEALPEVGLVGLDHAFQRLGIRIGKRLQDHRAPPKQGAPGHADPAKPVQIVDRAMSVRQRLDEPAPQLGLAHAGERSCGQAVERAPASSFPLDAEKALTAASVDAVTIRSLKSASRADPVGVAIPRMVGNRGQTRLRVASCTNVLLHIRKLPGTEVVQQTEDEGVEIVVNHGSGEVESTVLLYSS